MCVFTACASVIRPQYQYLRAYLRAYPPAYRMVAHWVWLLFIRAGFRVVAYVWVVCVLICLRGYGWAHASRRVRALGG